MVFGSYWTQVGPKLSAAVSTSVFGSQLKRERPKVSQRKKQRQQRVLSPEGRARGAEAVKRRWAAQKKAVAK